MPKSNPPQASCAENPMPIRPELKRFYGRQWRTVTRPRILSRAENKCEECGAPDRQTVLRTSKLPGWWFDRKGNAHGPDGRTDLKDWIGTFFPVRIVLTVAHLDHTPGHDDDDNLKALCQWCHLNYDKTHHAQTRATRKDRNRPILAALSGSASE